MDTLVRKMIVGVAYLHARDTGRMRSTTVPRRLVQNAAETCTLALWRFRATEVWKERSPSFAQRLCRYLQDHAVS